MAVSVAQSDLDRIDSPPADQGGSICLIQHLQEEEVAVLHLDYFEDTAFISGPGI